jgi:small subunit ribosomal protein S14
VAKKSKIARDASRRQVVERYASRRAALKAIIANPHSTAAEQSAAFAALARQPRDASATRLRNRDVVDGRARGYVRAFGLSRIRFREMAHEGLLPGVRKSSW